MINLEDMVVKLDVSVGQSLLPVFTSISLRSRYGNINSEYWKGVDR